MAKHTKNKTKRDKNGRFKPAANRKRKTKTKKQRRKKKRSGKRSSKLKNSKAFFQFMKCKK